MSVQVQERGHFWEVLVRLEKRAGDIDTYEGGREAFHRDVHPYEVIEVEGNILVNAGIQLMLDLLIGAGGTVFSNANARLAVGDGTTAAAASQTDLVGTNKTRKAMEATYPSRSGQTLTFRSAFGGSDANHGWKEWAIANAASGATILNRKVHDFGTKASGTWTLTATVTIS